MIAALLYVIGLVVVLVTVVLVGYGAPAAIGTFTAAMDAGTANIIAVLGDVGQSFAWSVYPFMLGLGLMGFGRVIMLLGSIDRSLKGGS
jgi:hypothetical protein